MDERECPHNSGEEQGASEHSEEWICFIDPVFQTEEWRKDCEKLFSSFMMKDVEERGE